jgi:hypothetical protein
LHPTTESLFAKYFLADFISLANDKVVNVRMSLCEVIAQHHKKYNEKSMLHRSKELHDLVLAL